MGIIGDGLSKMYTKEGKGVDRNEPKKKGYFLFMDIIFHKFFKFIKLNLLYSALSFLWFVLLCFIAPISQDFIWSMTQDPQQAAALMFGMQLMFATIVFNLWGCAPFAPIYAYVTRCYTRGEHAWLIQDGWEQFKGNFKQSIALTIIDLIVLYMGTNSLYFYYVNYVSTGETVWMLLCGILLLCFLIYTVMHYYIYQIMVTFKCTFMQLIKNSILCAIANLPVTVFHTLLSLVITLGLFFSLQPQVVVVLIFAVGLCLTRYPMEFYAARVLERIIKAEKKKNTAKITYTREEL